MKYLKPYFVKIASNKQTTGLGHITIADLKHMNIILPDMKIQHIIATILSSLDDEIELNRQINTNLPLLFLLLFVLVQLFFSR